MDIVEQLRTHDDERLYEDADVLMSEAADEITRLRQQVSELTTTQCTAPWRDSPPCSGITRATEGLAQQVATLTEQRDLAVEALTKAAVVFWALPDADIYAKEAEDALAAIQSSKSEAKG